MRFLIKVDSVDDDNVEKKWNVTITCPSRQDSWHLLREMRKVPIDSGRSFPAPLETYLTEQHLQCCALCAAKDNAIINTTYESIRDRRPEENEVEQFGHYLFETLLGKENWGKMMRVAEEGNERTIELALALSTGGQSLGWLPWEMMRNDESNFLIAGSDRASVAITRIVTGVERTPREMRVPPRVLFIVGTALDDPIVKPAVEYMGMLRQLKCNGYSVHARVVENATRGDIRATMKSFEPDVVHFICHGNIDDGGNPYLELMRTDEEEQQPTGDQIAQLLRVGDKYPSIVVLSACHSATEGEIGYLQGSHVTAPLAVQLVRGGVPIVIGMAGEISNFASRIFTRRFGMALVEGEPLIAATALARRAAFAEGPPPRKSVDWAFPVLYLAENIDPEYIPVPRGQIDPGEQMRKWIGLYDVERSPVFCGREEFFREYYKFFDSENKIQVLAIEAPQNGPGYGKTRLLQELTMQALRDGHVPCLLSAENRGWVPPANVAELGQRVSRTIFDVRRIFNLGPPPPDSQLILLKRYASSIEQLQNEPALDQYIQSLILQGEAPTSPQVVAIAIQQDLVRLARDVREKVPLIQQTRGRIIVLLDAIESYHQVIADLCNRELMGPYALGPHGLGNEEEIIPVVLAYSKPSTPTNLQMLLEKNPSWLEHKPLEAFKRKGGYGEDMLAYVTLLLHYKDEAGNAMPLVVDEEGLKDPRTRKMFWGAAHLAMKGIPGVIVNGGLHDFVEVGKADWDCLREANDNVFWSNWIRSLNR